MSQPPLAPGKRDPEGRRRAILHAATEIIISSGPAALTHRAIATHAGVSLGSTTQYFASIDELREAALHQLAQEIDRSIANLEPHIHTLHTDPSGAVTELLTYLDDPRSVRADIALISSGTTDPSLRALATRWPARLIEMLTPHFGHERAEMIAVYIDGATIHAGLHQQPLSRHSLTRALRALANAPTPNIPETPNPLHTPNTPGARPEKQQP